MRRWFCVLVLLFGFAADPYTYAARPATPVPIERGLWTFLDGDALGRTIDWWRLS